MALIILQLDLMFSRNDMSKSCLINAEQCLFKVDKTETNFEKTEVHSWLAYHVNDSLLVSLNVRL